MLAKYHQPSLIVTEKWTSMQKLNIPIDKVIELCNIGHCQLRMVGFRCSHLGISVDQVSSA